MTRFSPFLTSTAIGLCLVSQSAMADVTPADIWQDWRDYMLGLGYSMTATENRSGDTLAISDLQLDLSAGSEDGEVRMTIDALNLVQNDDGTVSVVMPDVMPLVLEVTPASPEAESLRMALTLTQTGQNMTISGTPTDMSNDYVAGLVNVTLDQVTVDDQTYDADNAKFEMLMTDVKAQSETAIGQMRDYSQSGTISSVTYNIRFKNPDEPAIATIGGTSSEISYTGDGQMPLGLTQVTDMSSMLRAGWDAAAKINGGASTLTVDVEDPINGNMAAAFATESSALTIETNAQGVTYAGTREGTTLSVQPPELPFPLSATMENAAFNLSAPVLQSDTPQDFALGLNLNELVFSDMIWGMFDPQGNLPRDPANIALDVTGEATLMTDFMDPAATQDMAAMSELPGLLNADH